MSQKLFIKKIVFFCILIGSLAVVLNETSSPKGEPIDYLGALTVKHERAKSIKTPRLIFAGGSNLAFGINSKEIQSKIKIPDRNIYIFFLNN